MKTRIWKLTEINAGWGRGERQRGKEKCSERRGSQCAEEIVLAWWPEAFQLSGHHYLSSLPLRSCVLVLRCWEVCLTQIHTSHSQTPLRPHLMHSLAIMVISSCVCTSVCVCEYHSSTFMFLVLRVCLCVYIYCLLCYLSSVLRCCNHKIT